MAADEVVARISADEAFYRNSGGGVTFSGGEPLLQPEFLEELLVRCKGLGIHTALETCGHAPPETILKLEPLVDLFFFDVKAVDPLLHERFSGVSNEVILENLRLLAGRCPGKITVRVPIVPGYTDTVENLSAIASMASALGIGRAELMPYHDLGRDKYEGLGRSYPLGDDASRSPRPRIESSLRIFREQGVACEIGGA